MKFQIEFVCELTARFRADGIAMLTYQLRKAYPNLQFFSKIQRCFEGLRTPKRLIQVQIAFFTSLALYLLKEIIKQDPYYQKLPQDQRMNRAKYWLAIGEIEFSETFVVGFGCHQKFNLT